MSSTQLALADYQPAPVGPRLCSDPSTIAGRWEAFHAAHPEVYAAFERLALEAWRRGKRRVGAKALWERMRWDLWIAAGEGDGPKLNNDYTALYAREFARRNPALRGLFEFRKRGGDTT